jgi:histidinol-phosphate aminotransferase
LNDINIYEAGKPVELVVREFGIDEKDIIKLASNENPLGTSPKAARVICENSGKAHIYPDDSMYELKKALSEHYGVGADNIIIGAGSDQILEFISHLVLSPDASILTSAVSFAMYDIYAKQYGAKIYKTASYSHEPDEFIKMIKLQKPDLVYICTPNNPTGDALMSGQVKDIIESTSSLHDVFFVIDGAYMEYAAARGDRYSIDPSEFLNYDNVL